MKIMDSNPIPFRRDVRKKELVLIHVHCEYPRLDVLLCSEMQHQRVTKLYKAVYRR